MKRETLDITTTANLNEVETAILSSFSEALHLSLMSTVQNRMIDSSVTNSQINKQVMASTAVSAPTNSVRLYSTNHTLLDSVRLFYPFDDSAKSLILKISPFESNNSQHALKDISSSGVSVQGPLPMTNSSGTWYIMSFTIPILNTSETQTLLVDPADLRDSSATVIGYATTIINTDYWLIDAVDPMLFTAIGRTDANETAATLQMPMHNLSTSVRRAFKWNETVYLGTEKGQQNLSWIPGIIVTARVDAPAFRNFVVISNEVKSFISGLENSLNHALIICACLTVVIGFVVLALVSRARTRHLVNLIKSTGQRKRLLDESRQYGRDADSSPQTLYNTSNDTTEKNDNVDPEKAWTPHYVPLFRFGVLRIKDEALDMSMRIDSIFEALIKRYKVLEEHVEARQTQIAEAKRVADDANAAKTHFLARVTHELRTPLNGILGTASLCMDETDIQQIRTSLKTIYKCGELLLHLLTDLLSFSQSESENTILDEQEFMMQDVTTQILAIFREQTAKGKVRLDLDVDPESQSAIVYGDLNRILQVVFNLLSNSLKFTPDGGHVKFTVRCDPIDHGTRRMVTFVVADNGPGIAEHLQARVFEAFVQGDIHSKKVRKAGVGLGLSICKQLAERMHGTISLKSELGNGAEFTFRLPLKYIGNQRRSSTILSPGADAGMYPEYEHYNTSTVLRRAEAEVGGVSRKLSSNTTYTMAQSTSSADAVERASSSSSSDRASLSRPIMSRSISMEGVPVNPALRVLVADDNKVNQEVMTRMLNLEGLKSIEVADDGVDAIEKCKASAERGELFDIIFMDVQMPRCDGRKATQELRALGFSLPVVAVSAFANEENVEACLQAGMNLFLGKPLKRPSLHRLLQGLQDLSSLSMPAISDQRSESRESRVSANASSTNASAAASAAASASASRRPSRSASRSDVPSASESDDRSETATP